jgi:hypothetical protein
MTRRKQLPEYCQLRRSAVEMSFWPLADVARLPRHVRFEEEKQT